MTKRALVIDDSPEAIAATRGHLEGAGWEVEALDSPFSLVETLRRRRPELLLVDDEMPAMSGAKLLGIARAHRLLEGIVVLMQTDRPDPELPALAAAAGAQGAIRKGGTRAAFLARIDGAFRERGGAPASDAPAPWDDEFLTGLAWQDRDHKALHEKLGKLIEELGGSGGREAVVGAVGFLIDFTEYHFAAEETWMVAAGDPVSEKHRAEHRRIREEIERFERRVAREGATPALARELRDSIPSMLVSHMKTLDAELAKHLLRNPPKTG